MGKKWLNVSLVSHTTSIKGAVYQIALYVQPLDHLHPSAKSTYFDILDFLSIARKLSLSHNIAINRHNYSKYKASTKRDAS